MKHKIINIIIFFLILVILLPNQIFAISIENTIKEPVNTKFHSGQDAKDKVTLLEEDFEWAISNFSYTRLLKIAFSIICVFIVYYLWIKYRKDEMIVDTVEYYPPDDLNSADVALIYNGYSGQKAVISLLIYLANKGYLRIEEYEETKLKIFKSKKFKIIKVKEYDGDNEDEREFFNILFKKEKLKDIVEREELKQLKSELTVNDLYEYELRDEVIRSDLYNRCYWKIEMIKRNINRKENKKKIFEKNSLGNREIILIMIAIIFMSMGAFSVIKIGSPEIFIMVFVYLIGALVAVYIKSNVGTVILSSSVLMLAGFFCMFVSEEVVSMSLLIEFIIHSVCMVVLLIFLVGMKKRRTKYGKEMLGKIQGFKNFIKRAKRQKLEQLVMEDRNYFYNVLPYVYALGDYSKWMKKFKKIDLEAPNWFNSDTSFSTKVFSDFMNSTFSDIAHAMSYD